MFSYSFSFPSRFNIDDDQIPRSNFDSFWRALITVFQVRKSHLSDLRNSTEPTIILSKDLPTNVRNFGARSACSKLNCCNCAIEWFSFECPKVIWFFFTALQDWFKKLAPLCQPIRSETRTNRDSGVFPRFASAIFL